MDNIIQELCVNVYVLVILHLDIYNLNFLRSNYFIILCFGYYMYIHFETI